MNDVRPKLEIAWVVLVMCFVTSDSASADWNQWRGDGRNGVAAESPELIEQLPENGLAPESWSGRGLVIGADVEEEGAEGLGRGQA